MGYGV